MKKLLAAVLSLSLAPMAAFAEDGAAPAPSAEAAPLAAEPLAPTGPALTPDAPAATATTLSAPGALAAEQPAPGGFALAVGVDNSMSHTVFHGPYKSPTIGSAIGLSPSYGFSVAGVKLSASGRAAFSYEYTAPDGPAGNGRRWEFEDIGLGLSAPALFKDDKLTGISLSPRIGVSVPVSFASRWRGTITSLTGGVALARPFGNFSLGLNLGAGKTFFAQTTREISDTEAARRDDQDNIIFICRTDSENCGLRGVPSNYVLTAGASGSYAVTEKFAVALGVTLSKGVKHQVAVDEYSTKKTFTDGTPIADDVGEADRMIGSVALSYALTPAIGMSLSMQTANSPNGYDARGIDLPFFDVAGSGARTQYALGLSAAF